MSKEKREEELNTLFERMNARNASAEEIDGIAKELGVNKSQRQDRVSEQSMTLYPAQPDRVYTGEIISVDIDSKKVYQEMSPGVAVEHQGLAGALRQDDIGKRFSVAYDNQGGVQIKAQGAERGREKDLER